MYARIESDGLLSFVRGGWDKVKPDREFPPGHPLRRRADAMIDMANADDLPTIPPHPLRIAALNLHTAMDQYEIGHFTMRGLLPYMHRANWAWSDYGKTRHTHITPETQTP